jgi:hypothetical protein
MALFPTFAKYFAARRIDSRGLRQGLFPTFAGMIVPTSSEQRRALAELLALAIDERIEPAPLLEAWAADERGWQAARVFKIARLLRAGMPLDAAIARVRGALRPQDATALAVAADLHGDATGALSAFSAPEGSSEPVARNIRWALVYAATLLLVSLPILAFWMIRIAPVWRLIWSDFGMPESPSMKALGAITGFIATFWYLPVLACFVALIGSKVAPRVWAGLWRTVGLGGLGVLGDVRAADLLGSLDVAAAAGQGEHRAAAALATGTSDRGLRSILRQAAGASPRNGTRIGTNVLSTAETAALAAAPAKGWVTRALSRRHRERILDRMWLLSELTLPLFVMAMGVFVFIVALASMGPLFDIIGGLT